MSSTVGYQGWRIIAAGLAAASLHAAPALAAPTPAGTRIVNTARLSAATPAVATDSNTVTITVGEVIDAAIVAERATLSTGADGSAAPAFTVSNPGNGAGTFTVTADAGGTARVVAIAVDANGDGRVDEAEIAAAVASPSIALAAGEARRIVVLVAGAATATVEVTVVNTRGAGAPGTAIGDDAVVGATGARAQASTQLARTDDGAAARLDKAQEVRAPDGSSRAVRGAVITYTLIASFVRACGDASVDDPVPDGTAIIPGSIAVDGQPLTDAPDGDAAQHDTGRVRVVLGDVPAGTTRTIRFQAVIL